MREESARQVRKDSYHRRQDFARSRSRNRFYEDIRKTNAALDPLKLDSLPDVFVIDLWNDFTLADGTIKKELFTADNIHLSADGYAVYAARLKPMMDACFSGKPIPTAPASSPKSSAATTPAPAPEKPAKPQPTKTQPSSAASKAGASLVLPSKPVLTYAYAPYNESKLDPQIVGWPLSPEELAWSPKVNTRASLAMMPISICLRCGLSHQLHRAGEREKRIRGSNITHSALKRCKR